MRWSCSVNKEKETITVDEMAAQAGTISYEILCGVGKRVPRILLP